MSIYFLISKIFTPFFLFSNLLIIILILLFFFRKKVKSFFKFYLVLFFICLIFPFGNFFEYHFLKKEFYNKEIINDFDAILLLGGDERRLIYAIDLMKKYNNVKLIFAGGSGHLVETIGLNENKIFKKKVENILNDNEYFILKHSRNTIENLLAFKEFNKRHNFERVIILTSSGHMMRSLIISKKIGLNLYPFYWKKKKLKFSIINTYQSFSFLRNLRSFDLGFREILGILSLNFINLKN